MLKYLLTTILLILFTFSLSAQIQVTGKVTDKNNDPLPGATIVVKGTNKGVSTDFDGNYQIQARQGDVLQVTFVGFQPETKKIESSGNSLIINFSLKEDVAQLDDVVVVGYGSAKKPGTAVGSVATVQMEKLIDMPVVNIIDGLQGKIAGLSVITSSGEPSALSSIQVHGVGSFDKKNDVLIILDGFPITQAGFRSINPDDIESISILKDASATSIYGSRAANGIMYVTTKRGKAGKSEMTFSTHYGLSNLANTKPFKNLMSAAELARFWVASGRRTQEQMEDDLEEFGANTKWYKVYFRENMKTQKADLSFRGGSENTRYYLSAGYLSQEGIMHNSGFERITLRSNIDSRITNWLKLGLNIGATYYDMRENANSVQGRSGSDLENGTMGYTFAPFYLVVDRNGNRLDYIRGLERYHPEYLAEKMSSGYTALEFMPSGFLEIRPFPGLMYRISGGIQFNNRPQYSLNLPSHQDNLYDGQVSRMYTRFLAPTITNVLEYKFNVNHHYVTVLLGQEAFSQSYNSINASASGLVNDNLTLLTHAPNERMVTEAKYFNITKSYFARAEYNYDDRYVLDVSGRRDGSSKFSPRHKWGNFWSAGLMWRVKNEDFLINNKTINDLNVKFSVGTQGNSEIGDYTYLAMASTTQYNSKAGWIVNSYAGNPELTWEKQTKYMLSFETQLFNKLSLNLEFYNRITSDMLMLTPNAYTSGFGFTQQNVGKLQNRGVGLTVNVDAYRNKDVLINPYFNFNYNQDKVLALYGDRTYWPFSNYSLTVGQPMMYHYPILKGVNPETGENQWYVPSDNRTVTTTDESRLTSNYNQEALEQNTGHRLNPPINGGFGLTARYKAIALQADFSFSLGRYMINNDKYFLYNPTIYQGDNMSRDIFDYWKQPGDVTRFPKLGTQFQQWDTGLIENASFVRLKNITLSYRLPLDVIQQMGFFNAMRFYVSGRNVLTFTKYTGIDPENLDFRAMGEYPNTRQFVFGVELKF